LKQGISLGIGFIMGRDCVVRAGDALNLNDTDAQSSDYVTHCLTEPGARLRFTLNSEKVMDPQPAQEHVEPVHHEPVVAPEPTVIEAPVAAEPAPAVEEFHAETQAEAEPANGVPDLSQISALSGGNPIVTVVLALILVGGGTAGWKFWQKKSEQNHELSMKKVDMEMEMAGLNGAQPPPCQTASAKVSSELSEIRSSLSANGEAHKKLQEQIDDLSERLGKLEKKAASLFSGGFDPEELTERIEKLEKAAKAKKSKS